MKATLRQEFKQSVSRVMKWKSWTFDQAAQYVFERYQCGEWLKNATDKQVERIAKEIENGSH